MEATRVAGRGWGGGTVYQRSDGKWVGAAERPLSGPGGKRRRKAFIGPDRDVVAQRLRAWVEENRPGHADRTVRQGMRRDHMEHARTLATHTAREWREKVNAYGGTCHYCKRDWLHEVNKDHDIPVSRGGSDSIDNVVPSCVDCNMMKHVMTGAEFMAWAAGTGFFEQDRHVQVKMHRARVARISPAALKIQRRVKAGWTLDQAVTMAARR